MTVLKRLGRHELRGRERLLVKHTRPEPRTAAARWLRSLEGRASAVRPSAVIDIQDGLATELFRLAKASDVGATVDVARLPVDAETKETAGLIRGNVDVWAVYGPEDYELLVAIPEKQVAAFEKAARTAKTPFTAIGAVVPKKEHLTVVNREGERVRLEPRLWHQFVRRFGKSFD
jgi:thiamine-monophosphate kinase